PPGQTPLFTSLPSGCAPSSSAAASRILRRFRQTPGLRCLLANDRQRKLLDQRTFAGTVVPARTSFFVLRAPKALASTEETRFPRGPPRQGPQGVQRAAKPASLGHSLETWLRPWKSLRCWSTALGSPLLGVRLTSSSRRCGRRSLARTPIGRFVMPTARRSSSRPSFGGC